MTPSGYAAVLRRQWPLVALGLVLGLVASGLILAFAPRTYTASTTIYLSVPVAGDLTSGAYEGGLVATQRVPSYTEIATSSTIVDDVSARLGLGLSAADMQRKITVKNPVSTALLVISATDRNPELAAGIANITADSFSALVRKLEQPTDSARPAPLVPRVIEPATPPDKPTSPTTTYTVAMGAIIGLLLGLSLALLRGLYDTRVRSDEQVETATGAPVLGSIVDDPETTKRPVVVGTDAPESTRGDCFLRLATTLRHADHLPKATTVLVTGPTTEVGTSTVACNLAAALAAQGERVLLVEADLRRPKVAEYLKLPSGPGLAEVLTGDGSTESAVRSLPDESFDVLPAGRSPVPNPARLLSSPRFDEVLDTLAPRYDRIVIDAPAAGPVVDAGVLATRADGVLLVLRNQRARARDLAAVVEDLRRSGAPIIGTVLNRTRLARGRSPHAAGSGVPATPAEPPADEADTVPSTTASRVPDARAPQQAGAVPARETRSGEDVVETRRS